MTLMKLRLFSWISLGMIFCGLFLFTGCQSTSEPTFKRDVREALDHFYRGERYERNGDIARAEEEYWVSLEISPRPVTYYRLAQIKIMQEDMDSAKGLLQKALKLSPNYTAARQRMQQLQIMGGEEVEVEPSQQSMVSESDETRIDTSRPTSRMELEEDESRPSSEIDTTLQDSEEQMDDNVLQQIETMSEQEEQDQEIEEVEEDIDTFESESEESIPEETDSKEVVPEESLEDQQPSTLDKEIESQELESSGASLEMKETLNRENWNEAIQIAKRLLSENPEQPVVLYNMGIAHIQLQQYEQAESSLRQAIEYNPQFADAYNDLGVVLDYQGNKSDALQCYEKAIEISNHADAYFNLAKIREKEGDYKQAIRLYENYLEQESQDEYAEYARERIQKLRRLAY